MAGTGWHTSRQAGVNNRRWSPGVRSRYRYRNGEALGSMAEIRIERIPLENLVINPQNPRHMPQASQLEALAAMVSNQGMKLVRLADDIVDKGLNPSDVPLVTRLD